MKSAKDAIGMEVANVVGVKREARRCNFTSFSVTPLFIALLGLGFAGLMAVGTASPLWKIGRGLIEWRAATIGQPATPQKVPVLKLSLRNEGGAGNLPVQVFGRWVLNPAPPQHPFALLGRYQQEVTLTQTAIVEMPLTPLKMAPPGKPALEVVLTTGANETDRKLIQVN